LEPEKKKSKAPKERLGKVVFFLTAKGPGEEGLHMAEQIADALHVEIVLAYVVVVPRDLPLQAPLAGQEEMASKSIEMAKSELARRQVTVSAVLERGRDIGSALQQVMEESGASRLIVALNIEEDALDSDMKLVRSILSKIAQPVVFVRPAASR
jgi:hypothetical protein